MAREARQATAQRVNKEPDMTEDNRDASNTASAPWLLQTLPLLCLLSLLPWDSRYVMLDDFTVFHVPNLLCSVLLHNKSPQNSVACLGHQPFFFACDAVLIQAGPAVPVATQSAHHHLLTWAGLNGLTQMPDGLCQLLAGGSMEPQLQQLISIACDLSPSSRLNQDFFNAAL